MGYSLALLYFTYPAIRYTCASQAMYLISSSKKGIGSNQLHRILGVTLKAAWFMSRRIREAMRDADMDLFGGEGGQVQADATYIGQKQGRERKQGFGHKMRVVSLLDKRTGKVRSIDAKRLVRDEVGNIVRYNVERESTLVTDKARHYLGRWPRVRRSRQGVPRHRQLLQGRLHHQRH